MLISDNNAAVVNNIMEALDHTTMPTAAENKAVTKITASVPDDTFEFFLLLKTFINLLYALFGSSCPVYQNVKQVIKALNGYKRSAFRSPCKQKRPSFGSSSYRLGTLRKDNRLSLPSFASCFRNWW